MHVKPLGFGFVTFRDASYVGDALQIRFRRCGQKTVELRQVHTCVPLTIAQHFCISDSELSQNAPVELTGMLLPILFQVSYVHPKNGIAPQTSVSASSGAGLAPRPGGPGPYSGTSAARAHPATASQRNSDEGFLAPGGAGAAAAEPERGGGLRVEDGEDEEASLLRLMFGMDGL